MDTLINNLEKKYLKFKLGEEQREALKLIFSFINNVGFNQFCLSGSAGTGKSSITKLIIEYLDLKNINYQLVAPTHKAKKILSKSTDREVITIHQLLSLKPLVDVMDLDMKDLRFDLNQDDSIPNEGIVILDECSMINNDLYDCIVSRCQIKKCKILYLGDIKQIEPVKQRSIAKPFLVDNVFELTQIYRQSENNPLRDILSLLRNKPVYEYITQKSDLGSLFVYNKWKEMLLDTIEFFKSAISNNDPEKVKLLAYTNKRVEAFNKEIRNRIFDNPKEYVKGDILMAYDNATFMSECIENADDFQIKEAIESYEQIGKTTINGWWLKVWNFEKDCDQKLFVLSKNNELKDIVSLSEEIESLRINAIKETNFYNKKAAWRAYYKIFNAFLTPFDLILDGRTICKKNIDYGYAITVHKSQGSSYDNVIVDMSNILKCFNKAELRQLQYVAMSRTRKNIYMLM